MATLIRLLLLLMLFFPSTAFAQLEKHDHFFLVHFTPTGEIDLSFGDRGIAWVDLHQGWNSIRGEATEVVRDKNGRFLIAGEIRDGHDPALMVVRLNQDGTLDKTYGNEGFFIYPIPSANHEVPPCITGTVSMAKYKNNLDIVLGCSVLESGMNFAYLIRVNSNGELSSEFGNFASGVARFQDANSLSLEINRIIVDPAQRVVLVGSARDKIQTCFLVMRTATDGGSLDYSHFSNGGIVKTAFPPIPGADSDSVAMDLGVDAMGRIVACGFSRGAYKFPDGTSSPMVFALARYNPNGTLDISFDEDGRAVTHFGQNSYNLGFEANVSSRGVLAGGMTGEKTGKKKSYAFALYDKFGVLEEGFSEDGTLKIHNENYYTGIGGMAADNNGMSVIACIEKSSEDSDPLPTLRAARLTGNGSMDTAFSGDGWATYKPDYWQSVKAAGLVANKSGVYVAGSASPIDRLPEVMSFSKITFICDDHLNFYNEGLMKSIRGSCDGFMSHLHEAYDGQIGVDYFEFLGNAVNKPDVPSLTELQMDYWNYSDGTQLLGLLKYYVSNSSEPPPVTEPGAPGWPSLMYVDAYDDQFGIYSLFGGQMFEAWSTAFLGFKMQVGDPKDYQTTTKIGYQKTKDILENAGQIEDGKFEVPTVDIDGPLFNKVPVAIHGPEVIPDEVDARLKDFGSQNGLGSSFPGEKGSPFIHYKDRKQTVNFRLPLPEVSPMAERIIYLGAHVEPKKDARTGMTRIKLHFEVKGGHPLDRVQLKVQSHYPLEDDLVEGLQEAADYAFDTMVLEGENPSIDVLEAKIVNDYRVKAAMRDVSKAEHVIFHKLLDGEKGTKPQVHQHILEVFYTIWEGGKEYPIRINLTLDLGWNVPIKYKIKGYGVWPWDWF